MPINTPPLQQPLPVTPTGGGNGNASWPKAWGNWMVQAWAILAAAEQSGVTADRPTSNLWVGRRYWDTTLALPVYWNGTAWQDAAGNAV